MENLSLLIGTNFDRSRVVKTLGTLSSTAKQGYQQTNLLIGGEFLSFEAIHGNLQELGPSSLPIRAIIPEFRIPSART